MSDTLELADFSCPLCGQTVIFAPTPEELASGQSKSATFTCMDDDCAVAVFYVALGGKSMPDQVMAYRQVETMARQHAIDLKEFYAEQKRKQGRMN